MILLLIDLFILSSLNKKSKLDIYFYEVKAIGIPKVKELDKVGSEWVYLSLE